jgi:hypothetical protein
MSGNSNSRLLLTGIGPRLAVAILVSAVLWGGFFWATAGVGV